MAVPFSNTKLRVPKGFQNILECLAREVLRSQPDNIPQFSAIYFENLMKARSETGHDPAVHGAKLDDRNYNNEAFKKRSVDPSDPEQNQAALKIQTQFRQHSAKEEVAAMQQEVAATRIQAGFRGFMDREEVRKMKDGETPEGEGEEVDIDLNDPEVEQAAIKIQAGFKGFKARKELQGEGAEPEQSQQAEASPAAEPEPQSEQEVAAGESTEAPAEENPEEEVVDIDLTDPETEKAALKIQAGFRGYQARKDLGTDKEEAPTEDESPAASQEAPAAVEDAEAAEDGESGEKAAEEEEVVDIDLTDPEVEKAASKIQAGFKGYMARKELSSSAKAEAEGEGDGEAESKVEAEEVPSEDVPAAPLDEQAAPETENAEPEGAEPEPQMKMMEAAPVDVVTEEKSSWLQSVEPAPAEEDVKPEGEAEQEPAAEGEAAPEAATEVEASGVGEGEAQQDAAGEAEEIDIDLEDPEVEKAALKIQAGFKGFKTRKGLQGTQSADDGEGQASEGGQEQAVEEGKGEEGAES